MLVFIGYRLMCSCAFSLLLPVVVDRLDCLVFAVESRGHQVRVSYGSGRFWVDA